MTEQALLTGIGKIAGELLADLSFLALAYQRAGVEQSLAILGLIGLAGEPILALQVRHAPAVHTVATLGHHAEEAAEAWVAVSVRVALPTVGEHVLPLRIGEHGNDVQTRSVRLAQLRAQQGNGKQPHQWQG
jgi:hypothetical protein